MEPTNKDTTDNKQPVTSTSVTPDPDVKISFDDFKEFAGDDVVINAGADNKTDDKTKLEPAKEPAAKVEEPKTEPKPEDKKVEDAAKETEEAVQEVVKDLRTGKKDYTDIDPADIKEFSKMSQKSFEKLKPIYLEHKRQKEEIAKHVAELEKLRKGALPDSYYEHPRGYTLTREFEGAANQYTQAQMVYNHWASQLAKVKAGEETYQELYRNEEGQIVLSKPVTATKESLAEIENFVRGSENQLRNKEALIQTIQNNHNNVVKQHNDSIVDFETKSFPQFAGENAKAAEAIVQDTIKQMFPPAYHNNPAARVAAKAVLTIHQLGELVKKLQAEKGTTSTTNGNGKPSADAAKAGPTASSMAAADTTATKDDVTFDDFNAVIGRR